MENKKVLVAYYSQTNQLTRLVEAFVRPLVEDKSIDVSSYRIKPIEEFTFPWKFFNFFNIFPETVHMKPRAIVAPEFDYAEYDLIIIAYTVWFLSPSQPITAFLQHENTKSILKDKPVVTLIGCRNMWLMAQEKMKKLLENAQAKLVDNVVKIDACSSAASFITTPLWMLTGKKQAIKSLPSAGIAEEEILQASIYGEQIKTVLHSLPDNSLIEQPMLKNMQAVKVNEKLILSEKFAQRSFFLWGKLIIALGKKSVLLRKLAIYIYVIFLIIIILTVVPISALIKKILSPLMAKKIQQQKEYFSYPSGE